ncbi:hypothetical protein D3C81_804320 [compost metagenome]
MKKCENCGLNHSGDFGSGRFCCLKCARAFSTKNKRSEINEKVSVKMTKNKTLYSKTCIWCKKKFEAPYKSKKCCSIKCANSKNGSVSKPNNGGLRDGGGKSKQIEYKSSVAGSMKLNNDEIRIAKILDNLNINWERNKTGFPYVDELGNKRKFYPDFYIRDFNFFVEYKGWVDSKMKHKMNNAQSLTNFNLLIIYGHDKRYKDLGLNIEQIENNSNILFQFLR